MGTDRQMGQAMTDIASSGSCNDGNHAFASSHHSITPTFHYSITPTFSCTIREIRAIRGSFDRMAHPDSQRRLTSGMARMNSGPKAFEGVENPAGASPARAFSNEARAVSAVRVYPLGVSRVASSALP